MNFDKGLGLKCDVRPSCIVSFKPRNLSSDENSEQWLWKLSRIELNRWHHLIQCVDPSTCGCNPWSIFPHFHFCWKLCLKWQLLTLSFICHWFEQYKNYLSYFWKSFVYLDFISIFVTILNTYSIQTCPDPQDMYN